jgi:hypothetical protein
MKGRSGRGYQRQGFCRAADNMSRWLGQASPTIIHADVRAGWPDPGA